MGATGIEWTVGPNGEQGYTFNPWIGCTKISPACDHCYAETASKKFEVEWGPHGARRPISESTWRAPLAWDRAAERAGERRRVFCASMADVFDNHRSIEQAWRERLWSLIALTPNLDWMLLTKRPQNVRRFVPAAWLVPNLWPGNVWFGFTAETQENFDQRWQHAQRVPAPLIFVSGEPLLGLIHLPTSAARIGLFIIGGESGRIVDCRHMPLEAVRALMGQCRILGIPVFVKQLDQVTYRKSYKKFSEWPEWLQVRQQPAIRARSIGEWQTPTIKRLVAGSAEGAPGSYPDAGMPNGS